MSGSLRRPSHLLATVLIWAAVLACYANSLTAEFELDDEYIRRNSYILAERPVDILRPLWHPGAWRRVAAVSFAFNYYLHGWHVVGYHVVNMVVHAAAATGLYMLVTLTLRRAPLRGVRPETAGLMTALLFACHPVQTQAVTYLVQRMTSMGAMFGFWSLVCFVRAFDGRRRTAWLAGAALLALLGAGSKPSGAALPVFAALHWGFFLSRRADRASGPARCLPALLAGGVPLAAVLLLPGLGVTDRLLGLYAKRDFSLEERLLTQGRVFILYLGLLALPLPGRLNIDHHVTLSRSLWIPPETLFALCAVAAVVALGFALAGRRRHLSFCILWFTGHWAITGTVLPLELVFEHWLYVPAAGLFAIGGALFAAWASRGRAAVVVWGLLVAACGLGTVVRNHAWRDGVALWTDAARKSPGKARPHANLGNALSRRGRYAEAARCFRTALALDPGLTEARINLAVCRLRLRRPAQALVELRKARRYQPDDAAVPFHMGNAYHAMGRTDEADAYWRKALSLDPSHVPALCNLATLMEARGEWRTAMHAYQRALRAYPAAANAHIRLGYLYLRRMGDRQRAATHLRRGLELAPDHVAAPEVRRVLKGLAP